MVHKKRQILAASLVVALALAVAVNWYYNRSAPETQPEGQSDVQGNLGDSLLVAGTAEQTEDSTGETAQTAAAVKRYFSDAKLRQTQYRDEIREEIESLMESDALDEAGKTKLVRLLSALDSRQKQQTDCETLLKAKLGGECVVVLGEETAQVVVEPGVVNESTSLQIAEIMAQLAQISSDHLTIIEANGEMKK